MAIKPNHYQELLDEGALIFGYHPDEPFTSIAQILNTARNQRYYEAAVAVYAEDLARWIDTQVLEKVLTAEKEPL